jgi:two-component system, OmpR family, response regulator PhoP
MQPVAHSADIDLAPNRVRVLVLESDRRLRSVLCWLLDEDERFCVVGQASTEDQAVACDAPFDAALVELGLSGLGGLNVIGRLLQRDPIPGVVILADTGAVYLRDAAAQEGAIGYLVRPDDLEHLGDRLAKLLQPTPPPLSPPDAQISPDPLAGESSTVP